ncbi:MAG: HAMP domain-containing sensor histidine kinase [Myxococcota bacterium]
MVGYPEGPLDTDQPVRDLADVRREAMRAVLARLVVARVVAVPLFAGIIAAVCWLDPVPWRVTAAAALVGALAPLSAVEYWRWTRGLSTPDALPPNIVGMIWAQLGVVLVAGGLEGPLFPLIPVATLQLATVFGRGPTLFAAAGGQLVAIWGMAAVNALGLSTALPQLGAPTSPAWSLTVATLLTVMIAVASTLGTKVRFLVGDLVNDAIVAHDRERLAQADHARDLVGLTGEIAHELKNPLAAIKGLASLLARDLEGKPAERLAVLRGEVDRMQETLEQFLDLSRPLVPLTQTDVDLAELAREVAQATDGLARVRSVALELGEGEGVVARADRRKLRQVLVNLVHNAIEASPLRARVDIRAERRGAQVALVVADRGPGLPDELLGGLAFEPGVTTRPHGNGLGLTIARALVQQHGGTLSLERRDGGGTRVVATLPAAMP